MSTVVDAALLCRTAASSELGAPSRCCSNARAGPRNAGRIGSACPVPAVSAAARGGSLLAHASKTTANQKPSVVFMWNTAQRTGLVWGDWKFTGGGGRYSGGGGGGGGDGDQWASGYGDGGYFHRGFGTAAAFFFLGAKSLVCWCSEDAKGVATVMDLGYLLTMALLSFIALSATPLALLQPVRATLRRSQ